MPTWVTQHDILRLIAPVLSPRSDTFLVRSYGEVVDPITDEVKSKAWLEAEVQRISAYVDEADSPEDLPTTSDNQLLGRKLLIKSIRWLNDDEFRPWICNSWRDTFPKLYFSFFS